MKRSDMLKKIKEILDMNFIPNYQQDELSEALLFLVENAGMLPPYAYGYIPKDVNPNTDYQIGAFIWEPEDE